MRLRTELACNESPIRGGSAERVHGESLNWAKKLLDFQHYYYNEHRTHAGRKGHPSVTGVNGNHSLANLSCR